jgi:hypothetical protein
MIPLPGGQQTRIATNMVAFKYTAKSGGAAMLDSTDWIRETIAVVARRTVRRTREERELRIDGLARNPPWRAFNFNDRIDALV